MALLLLLIPFINFFLGRIFGGYLGQKNFFAIVLINYFFFFTISSFLLFLFLSDSNLISLDYSISSWLELGYFKVTWLFSFSRFSVFMSTMIILVALLVNYYSLDYMSNDPQIIRFFSYLSLFTGFMLVMVNAGNIILFFSGWEGVGLCSYLLINFWQDRVQASKAALKALAVNRVGDFFLLFGLLLVFKITKSTDFSNVFIILPYFSSFEGYFFWNFSYIDIMSIFFCLGAASKSAQFGLHTWLPDAMEGPTPVSALIHAATMVTAGLYLLIKFSNLIIFSPKALSALIVLGCSTIFVASLIALTQFDLKKIIAYSTCSQLGYIVVSIGAGYFIVGFYHLITHAFFKALLFLTAGGLIHSLQGEQDLRRLGSKSIKYDSLFYYFSFLIGNLAISGFLFFSGYYSKDALINNFLFLSPVYSVLLGNWCLHIFAFFTAFYSFRLLFYIFFSNASPSYYYKKFFHFTVPAFIKFSLSILMIFSIFAGYILQDFFCNSTFFGDTLNISVIYSVDFEFFAWYIKLIPFFFSLLGLCFGIFCIPYYERTVNRFSSINFFISTRFFFDSIVNYLFFFILKMSKNSFLLLDKGVLEWVGPYGFFFLLLKLSRSVDFFLFRKSLSFIFWAYVYGFFFLFFFLFFLTF